MTLTSMDELGSADGFDDGEAGGGAVAFERGLAVVLLEAADDDHVMGNRLCDWTGVAPTVEEDVSISNVAQDELGHAEGLYEAVADLAGTTLGALAYERAPADFRNGHLVERTFADWADTVVRQYCYDLADAIRFEALLEGRVGDYDASLAGFLEKVAAEEEYHTEHGTVWLETLAAEETGREKVQHAIHENWVDALAFFTPGPHGIDLAATGVYAEPLADQRATFVERAAAALEACGYEVPETDVEDVGAGRAGKHTDDLADLLAETREVREQGIDLPA